MMKKLMKILKKWFGKRVSVSGLPYLHNKSRVIGPAHSFSNGLEVSLCKFLA